MDKSQLIRVFFLCLLLPILAVPFDVAAQVITNITSSGLNTQVGASATLPGGQVTHNITGGTRPGNGVNLFHSFGQFNVGEGHIANFLNDSGLATSNILSRVTGGNPSNIFGTLQTTGFGNANLFLINPAGVIFGPSASLNVGGLVGISTADYIRLSDGVRFNAMPGVQDALLSTAPVSSFGFLGSNSAALSVQGSHLTVADGQGLSLVGGNRGFTDPVTGTVVQPGVTMSDAILLAPGGDINIASVGKLKNGRVPGEVSVDHVQPPTGFKEMGNISLQRTEGIPTIMQIEASGNSGGTITIRGGQIEIVRSRIVSDTQGAGSGGAVLIEGKDVSITAMGGEEVRIGSAQGYRAPGEPGVTTIRGSETITLNGARIGALIDPFAAMSAGHVTLEAPTITGGATFFIGGDYPVPSRLDLLGTNILLSGAGVVGGENFSPVDVHIMGTNSVQLTDMRIWIFNNSPIGSSITVGGKNIDIVRGSFKTSSGAFGGSGYGGTIRMSASKNLYVGESSFDVNAGGPYGANGQLPRAGTITFEAGKNVTIEQTAARAIGERGAIHVNAGQNVELVETTLFTRGNSLSLVPGAAVSSTAGDITIEAGKTIELTKSSVTAPGEGLANGGDISLHSNKILLDTSTVSAESNGTGSDGQVRLQAQKIIFNDSVVAP